MSRGPKIKLPRNAFSARIHGTRTLISRALEEQKIAKSSLSVRTPLNMNGCAIFVKIKACVVHIFSKTSAFLHRNLQKFNIRVGCPFVHSGHCHRSTFFEHFYENNHAVELAACWPKKEEGEHSFWFSFGAADFAIKQMGHRRMREDEEVRQDVAQER